MNKQFVLSEIKQRVVNELINNYPKSNEPFGALTDLANKTKSLPEFGNKCSAIANDVLEKYDSQISEELHEEIVEDFKTMLTEDLVRQYLTTH